MVSCLQLVGVLLLTLASADEELYRQAAAHTKKGPIEVVGIAVGIFGLLFLSIYTLGKLVDWVYEVVGWLRGKQKIQ